MTNIKDIKNQRLETCLKNIKKDIEFLIDLAYSQGKIDALLNLQELDRKVIKQKPIK